MGDSSLILARDLRKRTRDQLISIVEERGISGSHIRDVFDLADALLEESSVADALAHIPRSTLVRVSSGQLLPEDQLLCRVGLAVCEDETITSLPGVAVVAGRLCETWKLQAGDLAPTELAVNDEKASVSVLSRAGLERGLILVSALDELIERISTQSAKRHSNGVLAAGDTTRLGPTIEHVGISLDVALALCVQAGLLSFSEGWYLPSRNLSDWREANPARRWSILAVVWVRQLDERLRTILLSRSDWGDSLEDTMAWAFPLDPVWAIGLAHNAVSLAEHLGLCVGGRAMPAVGVATTENLNELEAYARGALPPANDTIYVQNDFTIVAPGLLTPDADGFLRRMCDVEHAGIASTFRLSATKIFRTLSDGLSAHDLLARLEVMATTGIPQPVRYLIEDAGERFGAIRVREWGGGSLVICRDSRLLDLLMADIALAPLGWERVSETTATTRRNPQTTVDVLFEEKHVAHLESDDGEIVSSTQHETVPLSPRRSSAPASHTLVDRVLTATDDTKRIDVLDDSHVWRERQVSLAIRNKSPLVLTFGMPDGTHRSMTVIPLSLAHGRLRARDATTDVERTLPMDNVIELTTPVA